jgi:hypothetical protein
LLVRINFICVFIIEKIAISDAVCRCIITGGI